jgi:hypothetical protein
MRGKKKGERKEERERAEERRDGRRKGIGKKKADKEEERRGQLLLHSVSARGEGNGPCLSGENAIRDYFHCCCAWRPREAKGGAVWSEEKGHRRRFRPVVA